MKRRTVADVMTKQVVTVTADTPFTEIADAMAEHRISAVPVLDTDRHVTGIVTEADLLRKQEYKGDAGRRPRRPMIRMRHAAPEAPAAAKAAAVDARGLMSTPAISVAPHTTITEAARLLNTHGYKAMPVVGKDGRLAGIVARRDLLRVFHRSDADIRDEIIRDVLIHKLWQDPADAHVRVQDGIVHLTGRVKVKSLIPIVVRLAAATEGVVDVVHTLGYDHDDTHSTAQWKA
ncbi:CBS domain-containing protein [Actinomadura sp. 7K507]|uniref:CBS domain-containing protein n=1 Tax=Actinomadura sp. 7K507 TaxID=2530365 RepID=UPI00104B0753|nr:CBS domain-containing protein [Actinomadura sp. 7K507]TDC86778.1 CBS domain-containing protein [Actinomadura sp. 7K507]